MELLCQSPLFGLAGSACRRERRLHDSFPLARSLWINGRHEQLSSLTASLLEQQSQSKRTQIVVVVLAARQTKRLPRLGAGSRTAAYLCRLAEADVSRAANKAICPGVPSLRIGCDCVAVLLIIEEASGSIDANRLLLAEWIGQVASTYRALVS